MGWPYPLGATHEILIRATQRVDWPAHDSSEGEGGVDGDAESAEPPQPTVELDEALLPQVVAWLEAAQPGQDLRCALPTFQRRLVESLERGLPLLGVLSPALRALLADWRQLMSLAPGAAAEAEGWKTLRLRAGALGKQSQGGERVVAEFVEAAAWPWEAESLEWLRAWRDFLEEAVRVNLAHSLDAPAAQLLRARDQAWEALKLRAEQDPLLEFFAEVDNDPDMAAVETPEMQEKIQAALRGHARPLVQALLSLFVDSVADCPALGAAAGRESSTSAAPAAEPEIIEIGSMADFEAQVLASRVPVLLDFWAPWCGPCIQFMPVLAKLAAEYAGTVRFAKANIDEIDELSKMFNIRALPSLLVFQNGQAVERIMGLSRSRIEAVLNARLSAGAAAAS